MDYKNISEAVDMVRPVAADPNTPENIRAWADHIVNLLTQPTEPIDKFRKGSEVPSTIGALADEYADVRQRRLDLDKEAAAVKEREMEIHNYILSALAESTDTGASGKHHRVQLVMKERFNAADWPTLHKHIQKTGMFELLQKRLADTAVKEYREVNNGVLPDGVQAVEVPTLSFSKV